MQVEFVLLVISLLFFVSIFTDKLSSKFGVPALLLFLGVGMLFGEDGLGVANISNPNDAQLIGNIALCIILFAGGLGTKFRDIKPVVAEGAMLATIGVVITWLLCGFAIWGVFHLFGRFSIITLPFALLLSATMASTDAASVFAILGTRGIQLKHNLRPILELESGSNDPMAYIITVTMIGVLTSGETPSIWSIAWVMLWSLVLGLAVGFGFGKLMTWLMKNVSLSNSSLYPVMILTACIFMYSGSYFLGGNSYLAVYIGGLVIGNSKFPHKRPTMNFIDGLCWLSQLLMFLVLGLLVTPHNLKDVVVPSLIVSALMILLARPISVFLTLLPFRHLDVRDKTYLSWVGLKGAVPIILAIQCAAEGVPNSDVLFNIAFVCTIVSLLTQGTTLASLAQRIRLTLPAVEDHKPTHFDIDLPEEIREQAIEMLVTDDMVPMMGCHLMDLGLAKGTLVIMLRRGDEYIIPNGQTIIEEGDYLLLMTDDEHALVRTYDEPIWELELIENTGDFFMTKIKEGKERYRDKRTRRKP